MLSTALFPPKPMEAKKHQDNRSQMLKESYQTRILYSAKLWNSQMLEKPREVSKQRKEEAEAGNGERKLSGPWAYLS